MVSPKSLGALYSNRDNLDIFERSQVYEARKHMKLEQTRKHLEQRQMEGITF